MRLSHAPMLLLVCMILQVETSCNTFPSLRFFSPEFPSSPFFQLEKYRLEDIFLHIGVRAPHFLRSNVNGLLPFLQPVPLPPL